MWWRAVRFLVNIKKTCNWWEGIADTSPTKAEHSNDVDKLNEGSVRATLNGPIRVRIQNPIRIPGSESSPEPDVCWVREADYSKQHPGPGDILLLVEIADSSLERDRGTKTRRPCSGGCRGLLDRQSR
ncbi:Uma2 family endonuclease [Aeoliella straminimaris]|uniref:Uma2 family endonuclease n=1 Tax=Aeoliella straminimaris TaxID=2954799 RepID=UPI003CC68999